MLNNFSFLDFFLRGSLLTVNKFVIIFIVLYGYIFLKKDIFGRTFLIFAFAMVLNPFLKSLFQIPLPPASGLVGWGFPSGHMFTATVFWGWLSWEYKNKYLFLWSALLLGSMSVALVHFNYHYPSDVAAAFLFSILTLFLYHLCLKISLFKSNPPLIGFLLTLLAIILISFTDNITKDSFNLVALITLFGFSLGWLINNKTSLNINLSLKTKLIIFMFSILGLLGLEGIYFFTHTTFWPIKLIHYFIITLWLTLLAQSIVISVFKQNQK